MFMLTSGKFNVLGFGTNVKYRQKWASEVHNYNFIVPASTIILKERTCHKFCPELLVWMSRQRDEF